MIGEHKSKCFFCSRCDNVFKSKKARDNHERACFGLKTKKYLPRNEETDEVPKMKFRNFSKMGWCPFVAYADSEDFLRPMYKKRGDSTVLVQEHNASCWGFHFVGPDEQRKYFDFFPPNPTEKFVRGLILLSRQLFDEYWEPVVRTNLTLHQQSFVPIEEILRNKNIKYSLRHYLKHRNMPYDQYAIGKRKKFRTPICWICQKDFTWEDERVIDHDNFTGKYLGIAHDACNLKRRTKPDLVCFHNGNYDFVELLPKLLKNCGMEYETTCLPKTNQKFITLTMTLFLEKEIITTKTGKKKMRDFKFPITFIDTLSFLGASLDKVMKNIPEKDLKNTTLEFPNEKDFQLVQKKGVFPYGYMNDETKLFVSLPKQCEMFCSIGQWMMRVIIE